MDVAAIWDTVKTDPIIAAIIMPEREARHTAAENTVNTLEYEKV